MVESEKVGEKGEEDGDKGFQIPIQIRDWLTRILL